MHERKAARSISVEKKRCGISAALRETRSLASNPSADRYVHALETIDAIAEFHGGATCQLGLFQCVFRVLLFLLVLILQNGASARPPAVSKGVERGSLGKPTHW